MIQKIIDIIGKIPESIKSDIGLYVGAGLTVLVFVIALIVSIAGKGEFGKFVSLAKAASSDGTRNGMNAVMSKMPKLVVGQYRHALNTNSRPSESISVNDAVVIPFKSCAISKLAIATAIGTAVGMCAGVGISAVNSGTFGESEGLIVALVALVGGILTVISALISSATLKGGKKAHAKLTEALDNAVAHGGAHTESAPVREEAPHMNENVQASEPVYEQPEAYSAYEQPAAEVQEPAPEYTTPVYEQPEYAAEPVVEVDEPTPEEMEAERAHAREEALKAQRAEQEEIARKQEAEKAAAAQRRLEELRAQREAQLKARREAQAQQNATVHAQAAQAEPSVGAEDVIARIDKISKDGASLPAMKEVAMLLQKERNKPENKTPEQQKRLNEALAKLLKAMSAAQKK